MEIGAQLYTVREFTQTEHDFRETIKKVADIGYPCVQISGAGQISVNVFAEICSQFYIKPVITHTSPARIINETDDVISEHRVLGANYIGVGSMPGEYINGTEGVKKFIEDFSPAAEKIAKADMMFMYHNHAFEFEKFDGKSRLEQLIEGFSPANMGFTLDTYWVQAGGGDPAYWIEKLAGRVDVIHVKDMSFVQNTQRMSEIGEGNLNWPKILDACKKAGVKYAMVEQDDCYGKDPFLCLKTSFDNYKRGLSA